MPSNKQTKQTNKPATAPVSTSQPSLWGPGTVFSAPKFHVDIKTKRYKDDASGCDKIQVAMVSLAVGAGTDLPFALNGRIYALLTPAGPVPKFNFVGVRGTSAVDISSEQRAEIASAVEREFFALAKANPNMLKGVAGAPAVDTSLVLDLGDIGQSAETPAAPAQS